MKQQSDPKVTPSVLENYKELLEQEWVQEMLYYMERSDLIKCALQAKLETYRFQNQEIIEKEIAEYEAKKKKG